MTKEEFKAIRLSLGLTQAQFAKYIGVNNARTVRRYESGEWEVSGRVVCLLSEKE